MSDAPSPTRLLEDDGAMTSPFADHRLAEGQPDPVARAHERGRREGCDAGSREARSRFEVEAAGMRSELTEALRQLAHIREEIKHECAARMKQLALEAASRMLRLRIEEGDPVAARALREALEALPDGETIVARLHPDEVDPVGADLADEISGERIELVADGRISRGGCVVESSSGTIDATVETAQASFASAAEDSTVPS